MEKYLKTKIGQPIAIFCARYWYRGTLAQVENDYCVLTTPFAVVETGIASGSQPQQEDPIPSDLMISYGAIEIVCQPTWAMQK